MVLLDVARVAAHLRDAEARVAAALGGAEVRVSRQEPEPYESAATSPGARILPPRRRLGDRRRWATDVSTVLGEAFSVLEARRIALENDVLACVSRPGCSMLLLEVDGEPVAAARRASTSDGTYLSSIGTRPAWRGRGLGALVTMLAICDALDAGSDLIHLAVDVDNEPARRLYERLGFAVVGDPAPDMLLH
jgi:ribosomal protein S18 acetylase RimI-like enzyme